MFSLKHLITKVTVDLQLTYTCSNNSGADSRFLVGGGGGGEKAGGPLVAPAF